MKLEVKLLSSLDKIFPRKAESTIGGAAILSRNLPYSFQVAYRIAEGEEKDICPVCVRVETDLPHEWVSEYKIGQLSVLYQPDCPTENYYDGEGPNLYPDPLLRRNTFGAIEDDGFWHPRFCEQNEKHPLEALRCWQGLWFSLNEREKPIPVGKYSLTVRFFEAATDSELASVTLPIEVRNVTAEPQSLLYTSWFHVDCLADLYHVEMFSDRHFELIRSFAKAAADTGMNMILLPAFTPALDTTVGKERRTAQLVGVTVTDDGYDFDFDLLRRYVGICREVGVTHFEHSHFFTQWGAHHAPKVMATVDGEYKRIFGWDTAALSDEYLGFLRAYLAALMPVLDELGIRNNILFHISDEPSGGADTDYAGAHRALHDHLCGLPTGDALSHYSVYENSGADIPIVAVDSKDMQKFCDNCDNFWLYYTGGQAHDGLPNRLIATRAVQNRILGVFLYWYRAKGFLHWGYNYYYGFMSHGLYNPLMETGVFDQLAGTCYMVYPGADGEAIPSMRMKVQYEGFNDFRLFTALEKKCGREAVVALIEKHLGKEPLACPHENRELLSLMDAVISALAE